MTWVCSEHGEQIPDHNGTSYRCPLCTGRVTWRDERRELDGGMSRYEGAYRKLAEQVEEGECE